MEGPGRCEAAGKHFGMLGDCEAASRGGELGGELGDCLSAKRGGKQGGQLSLEVLEKCRRAGRQGGIGYPGAQQLSCYRAGKNTPGLRYGCQSP